MLGWRLFMRTAVLCALTSALLFAPRAQANCSHHTSGGSTGDTTPSGPDWNGTCIRWERIDAGADGGDVATDVAPQDGPSDGGTDGFICVETTHYGPSFGCGCEVTTAALGVSLLALTRLLRRRRQ
jgi:hypothetical protein